MEILIKSFWLVAAAEFGDKTQLLAIVLATRYKKPFIVLMAILAATLLNHGLASFGGAWLFGLVSETVRRYIITLLFVVFGFWIFVPDKIDEKQNDFRSLGIFSATFMLFFLAEMGDKTQLATVALGAGSQSPILVTLGTTIGMMLTNALGVFFGEKILTFIPMSVVRLIAGISFFGFAILYFFGVGAA